MHPAAITPGYHARIREDVVPLVPPGGGALLDLGGGTGATAVRLRQLGRADRVGVADLIDGAGSGAELDFCYVGNVEDRAFLGAVIRREGPFQTILCLDILEHLRDPWGVVQMLHRGLAPDGAIIASIPNVRNFTALGPLLFRNRWRLTDAGVLDRTHLRFFVRETAIELLTSSGLTLEEVRANPNGGRKVWLARALTGGLMNSFTDLQYLIRVRNTGIPPEQEEPCDP